MPRVSLKGSIETKTSDERRAIFQRLFNEVVCPQRVRLRQYRDITWQSAYVDNDGYLSEMVAAIVTGTPGVNRRGVTRTTGDLSDETEVKKAYRVDPNIDFLLSGTIGKVGRARAVFVARLPPELLHPGIAHQLNSNASSIQVIETIAGKPIGGQLAKTATKDALVEVEGGGWAIRLNGNRDCRLDGIPDGTSIDFCIRQERGHINFGKKTRAQLGQIFRDEPILVHYHHDPRGRFQVAVIRCTLEPRQIAKVLDRIFAGASNSTKKQYQPYLFLDNTRGNVDGSLTHSVAGALGGRVIALGVETPKGFEVQHWDPKGKKSVGDLKALFEGWADPSLCASFWHTPLPSTADSVRARRKLANDFFQDCMDEYYRALMPYCALTQTSRNIAFGNLAQHLVSLVTGIKGTRSGARGWDLSETSGSQIVPSEVKIATGEPGGDAMGTEDSPRLTLGWAEDKMLTWRRLFAVRIVDKADGLEALVHAPTASTMTRFRNQVRAYFDGRVKNDSGGLQYHALDPFPHDTYGPAGRRLTFVRVAQFRSDSRPLFPNPVPEWGKAPRIIADLPKVRAKKPGNRRRRSTRR